MTALLGGALGAAFVGGLLLLASVWLRGRRPALYDRVAPYVRDVQPDAYVAGGQRGTWSGLVAPVLAWAGDRLGRTLGGTASVEQRLARLGSGLSVAGFRVQQVLWGVAGFALCAALSLLWLVRSGATSPALLVLCGCGAVVGVLARDNVLTSQVNRREQRMREELPTVADLLALAVAAGEGPAAGLERVVKVSHGELSRELARVLADVRTGTTMTRALDDLAARTGLASLARFAEGLAVAVDRGTPLVDVLHAQAADVRESGRRELMELGGRREVAMMLPVVFLILPVTVVFAFYPGLIGLSLTSGT